jgi:hypothetical protein
MQQLEFAKGLVRRIGIAFDYVRSSAFGPAVAAISALARPIHLYGLSPLASKDKAVQLNSPLTAASAANALATSEMPD